jgi:hypothetical protein
MYRVAQQVLKGEFAWMEQGIMSMLAEEPAVPVGVAEPRRESVAQAT